MSLTRASAPPTHELPIVVTDGDTKSIYCIEIELTQSDMGYELPKASQARSAAPHHVHVYADTVVMKQPLVLPGRNLGVFARAVMLAPGAAIDVSGASADKSFAPQDYPQQKDVSAGANGANGDNASAGGAAGNITIVADEIVGIGTGAFGSPTLETLNLTHALTTRLQQAIKGGVALKVPAFTVPVMHMVLPFPDQPPNPYPFKLFAGTLQLGEMLIALAVDGCRLNADGTSATVLLTASYLECKLASTLAIDQVDSFPKLNGTTQNMPLATAPFSVQVTVPVKVDTTLWKLGDAQIQVAFVGGPSISQTPKLSGDLESVGACTANSPNLVPELTSRMSAAIVAWLRPLVDGVVAGMNSTLHANAAPHLVALARGYIGGRGQDGHSGVKGSKGIDGKRSNTEVYDMGTGVTAPAETFGKKGNKGGRAGSAGTSGDGGKGGAIAVSFVKAWPLRIVMSADGGAGGDKADPGAQGPGGDGGDGGPFWARTFSNNVRWEATGPAGPTGDSGDPAEFAGKTGNPGTDGSTSVNGAAFATGGTVSAGSYDLIAPSLKLEQLLMVQREGKLTYLNASGKADYDYAATLFLWLCNVSPETVTSATARNALPIDDRNARAAIRASAQVELLRLRRGLDYFGHPYNWAPILRLSHTQRRATELIDLGKIVEQQYNDYTNTNKTITEKLAALDQTVRALSGDLGKALSAEEVLKQQIVLAEGVMASLQFDMETQTSVMKRHQEELEAEIRKEELAKNCGLENIIKIISAVIAIGAGAVNGVSEIAGAAELAAIVKEAKAAAEAAGQLKALIEEMMKTTATLNGLAEKLSAVDAAAAAGKPDSVKLVVAREEFEENIKPLLEKFPNKTKELRSAVRAFFALAQTRNEKVVAYNALFVQKAELTTHRQQIAAQITSINAIRSENKESLVPAAYLTFFKSALTWSKQNLIKVLYEETRAFHYHTGTQKKELLEKISDLNIASLADTQARLLTAYDEFLNTVGRPYSPLNDVKVTISRADAPSAFEALPTRGRITFTLDASRPEFSGLTLVKADSVAVALPSCKGGKTDELNVALMMMGEGAVRPVDDVSDASILHFNCPPRAVSYKYSFDPDRRDPVVQPGTIADTEFSPLSPFTTWTLDFGLKDKLNAFVNLSELQTIELHFTGHAFGRKMQARGRRPL